MKNMGKRELIREIDNTFKEAGQYDEWIYREYKSLYELGQLARFQIFDMNWFPGAAKILYLVDQLHTLMTPKEDFITMASLLNLDIDPKTSKSKIVEIVKSQKNWRTKAFELDTMKQMNSAKSRLQPLYEQLKKFGYKTDMLPRQVSFRRWMLDAENLSGTKETLYLNESDVGHSLLIQSTYNSFVGIIADADNLLVERV